MTAKSARQTHEGIGVCSPNPPQTPPTPTSFFDFDRVWTNSTNEVGRFDFDGVAPSARSALASVDFDWMDRERNAAPRTSAAMEIVVNANTGKLPSAPIRTSILFDSLLLVHWKCEPPRKARVNAKKPVTTPTANKILGVRSGINIDFRAPRLCY